MKDRLHTNSRYFVLALVIACLLSAVAWPMFDGAIAQNAAGKFNGLIAFVSNRNGPPGEIYVMNPDGSGQRNITNSPASETRPAFSPDGKKIAFIRDFQGIFVMNPDGSGQRQILDGPPMGFGSITSFPDWSPDGKKIAFNGTVKSSSDGADVYVINADGTGLTRLTTDPADDSSPAWSPDGTKIAFSSIRNRVPNEVNYEIYVMNADGSNQTRITNNTKFDSGPAWSPDGRRIAFTSRRDDNFEVYVMNADGSNQTRLTKNPEQDSDPKWSADGTKIVFLSSRDGRFGEIYTMNPDGSGLVNLTNTEGVFEMDPSWQRLSEPFVPMPSPTPATTPTPSPTPSPSPFWVPLKLSSSQVILDVLTCGGRTFITVKVAVGLCDRVVDWGQVEKSGNDFAADIKAETLPGALCGPVAFRKEHVYDLGVLAPGTYSFTVTSRGLLVNTKQFSIGGQTTANPIDDPSVFVFQHYQDFLGRNPDDDGFSFWTRNMTQGCGTDAACLERKRVDTSAAFFLSLEFQKTGFLVYRMYQASFGRMPRREEFFTDLRALSVVINQPGWEKELADKTDAFVVDWVNRPDFRLGFDQLSDVQFVDRLLQNTGINLSTSARDALIADLAAGRQSRAVVLQTVVDDADFVRKEFNPAFVLSEYFGYLQRNPDEGLDTDMSGYNFWLNKLNQFGGDYVRAEMVKAFLSSSEYRARFCSQ